MPRAKRDPSAPVDNSISVERPKTVSVTYRNESGQAVAAVHVNQDGILSLVTSGDQFVTPSDKQLRDLRSRISKSLNSRKHD